MPLSASDKLIIEQIDDTFSWEVAPKYATNYLYLRSTAKSLAQLILDFVPEGRERNKALSHLEEAGMWINAAIAAKHSEQ